MSARTILAGVMILGLGLAAGCGKDSGGGKDKGAGAGAGGPSAPGAEISSHPELVAITCGEVGHEGMKPTLSITFRNTSGKDMTNVQGSFLVRTRTTGKQIDACGVNRRMPLKAGEKVDYQVYSKYMSVSDELKKAFAENRAGCLIEFRLSLIEFADGTKKEFED